MKIWHHVKMIWNTSSFCRLYASNPYLINDLKYGFDGFRCWFCILLLFTITAQPKKKVTGVALPREVCTKLQNSFRELGSQRENLPMHSLCRFINLFTASCLPLYSRINIFLSYYTFLYYSIHFYFRCAELHLQLHKASALAIDVWWWHQWLPHTWKGTDWVGVNRSMVDLWMDRWIKKNAGICHLLMKLTIMSISSED